MAKKLISIALLGFVAAALVMLALRGRGAESASPPSPPPPSVAPAPVATGHLVTFYFHGDKRCQSCNAIERLTREALKSETDGGMVEIRSVNVDEAPNAHFVQDFQLAMRTVVLAEEAGGKVTRWKRLDECWDRFRDVEDYTAYIQRSFKAFRAAAPTAPAAP